MTRNYNRSEIYNFWDLLESQQEQVKNDFCLDEEACLSDNFFKSVYLAPNGKIYITILPASRFIKINGKFTHGIYADSAFSGYFVTISKCNTEAVIAYKYF